MSESASARYASDGFHRGGSAAVSRTEEVLAHLESLIAAMQDTNLRYEELNELDTEFHVTVARASKNVLATDLMQALRDAVRHKMTAVFSRLDDWRAAISQVHAEHEKLVPAIRDRNPTLAAEIVAEHIERVLPRPTPAGALSGISAATTSGPLCYRGC